MVLECKLTEKGKNCLIQSGDKLLKTFTTELFAVALSFLEQFSNGCRKANAKVITSTNHNKSKQHDESIRILSNSISRKSY